MKKITITQGLSSDSPAIKIRKTVFVEEQGFQEEFDTLDETAYHLVLYLENQPVATGRLLLLTPQEGKIGRVAVLKPYRKQHFGAQIISALEEKAVSLGISKILISAQVQAQGFYEKLGYIAYGDVYLEEHCPHVSMEKILN